MVIDRVASLTEIKYKLDSRVDYDSNIIKLKRIINYFDYIELPDFERLYYSRVTYPCSNYDIDDKENDEKEEENMINITEKIDLKW